MIFSILAFTVCFAIALVLLMQAGHVRWAIVLLLFIAVAVGYDVVGWVSSIKSGMPAQAKTEHTVAKKVVKTIECTDTRTGTKFSFTTDNILESGTEFPTFGTWIKVRDTEGNIRELFDSMHRYMACEQAH